MSGQLMIAASEGSPVVTGILLGATVLWIVARTVARYRLHRASLEETTPADDADPGWEPAVARLPKVFPNPRETDPDPLTVMRIIFLGLEIALFLWLLVLSFVTPWSDGDVGAWPWIVVAAGLLSLAGVAWVRRRQFNTESETDLAGQFRTAMFLGIGIAEIAWLVGLVATLLTKSLWIYLLGLGFAFLDMTLVAPGRAEIARRQRQIDATHPGLSLTRSLLRPSDRPRTD